jgi:hypothetical protein
MAGGGGGSVDIPITEAEVAQAQISRDKWNDFITRYMPVEAELQARVGDLNSEAARNAAVMPYLAQGGVAAGNISRNNALRLATGNGGYESLGDIGGTLYGGIAGGLSDARQNYLTQAKALADLGSGISNQALGAYNTTANMARDKSNQMFADKVSRDIANSAFNTSMATSIMDAGTSYGMNKYVIPQQNAAAMRKYSTPQNTNFAGSVGYTG